MADLTPENIEELHLDEIPEDESISVPVDMEEYFYLRKAMEFADQVEKILARRGALKETSWDINYLNVCIEQPSTAIGEILAAMETLLPSKFLVLEAEIANGQGKYKFFTDRYTDRRAAEREELTGEKKEGEEE